jgi:Domain of unknown function (DUF1905)/Bacteriocin-protection, YdeI or OmpD-Associated
MGRRAVDLGTQVSVAPAGDVGLAPQCWLSGVRTHGRQALECQTVPHPTTVSPSACRYRNGEEDGVTQPPGGARIRFDAPLATIDTSTVVRLPATASKDLPSRGQVAVRGTINGVEFQTVLEPDGTAGHWMRVDDALHHAAGINQGDTATLDIEVTRDWPEPTVPQDFAAALLAAPQKIQNLWSEITPMARWEWVRWINATKNPDTRRRRVDVSISKMTSGKRRPCCFDLSACTDPDLSKNGRLLEPGDNRL